MSQNVKSEAKKKANAVSQIKFSPTPPLSPITPSVETPSISQKAVDSPRESRLPSPATSPETNSDKVMKTEASTVFETPKKRKLEEVDSKAKAVSKKKKALNATAKWVVEEKGVDKDERGQRAGKAMNKWIVREQVIDVAASPSSGTRQDLASHFKTAADVPSWDGQRTSTFVPNSRKRASRDDMEYDQGKLSRHQRRKLMKQRAH
jgi:hypothetical protein